jgi:pseudouridylate synthase
MILASMAGIRVFATGGIGGVHRGAEVSMDISADLKELSHTPVTVVCSGVKSILDIPKTLEVLEYMGVPVFSFQSEAFPAFFTNESGCRSPLVARSSLVGASLLLSSNNECSI